MIPIHIPALVERPADVLPLARHFLHQNCREMGKEITGWTKVVERHLRDHSWPGNVRELQNLIERAVVMARGDVIELEDFVLGSSRQGRGDDTLEAVLNHAEKVRIREALAEAEGKRIEAASILDIDRTTLYRLMKKHGITDI